LVAILVLPEDEMKGQQLLQRFPTENKHNQATNNSMKTMRTLSIVLQLVIGAAAVLGGGALLIDPSGSRLGLPQDLLSPTMFGSYLVPGLILFLAIGVFGIATGILTIIGNGYSTRLRILYGAVVTCWVGSQVFLLEVLEPIQIIVGGIGFILFCLALLEIDEVVAEDDVL
jgi:hypothetical protein